MDVLYTVWGFRVGDGRNEALLLLVPHEPKTLGTYARKSI